MSSMVDIGDIPAETRPEPVQLDGYANIDFRRLFALYRDVTVAERQTYHIFPSVVIFHVAESN